MPNYREELQRIKLFGKPPKEKKKYRIPKKSTKKLAEEKAEKDSRVGGESELDRFFVEARKVMTGKCLFCGGKTEKNNDETYRRSIAHLLPKRKNQFPSIATNQDGWIELCFYGNSCHTNFDAGMITWDFLRDSSEWTIIVEKFLKIFPFIPENEKKNIPELLLKYV